MPKNCILLYSFSNSVFHKMRLSSSLKAQRVMFKLLSTGSGCQKIPILVVGGVENLKIGLKFIFWRSLTFNFNDIKLTYLNDFK